MREKKRIKAIGLLIIIVIVANSVPLSAASSRENLFVNPGFEEGLEGWVINLDGPGRGEISIDSRKKHTGEKSLKMTSDSDVGNTLQLFQANIPVESLTEYEIGLFYCMEGMVVSSNPNLAEENIIDIYWYDQNGKLLNRHNSKELYTRIRLDNGAADWTNIRILETSPENAAKVSVYIHILRGNRGTGGSLWIDDFSFFNHQLVVSALFIGITKAENPRNFIKLFEGILFYLDSRGFCARLSRGGDTRLSSSGYTRLCRRGNGGGFRLLVSRLTTCASCQCKHQRECHKPAYAA
jgi:hypothetical protein